MGTPTLPTGGDVLYYARSDGGAWQREIVDAADMDHVGTHSSLALDADDRPHISYRGGPRGGTGLKYAHFDGTSWLTETVDNTGNVGEDTSLALDDAGRPHISYYDYTHRNLKYAHFDGASWQIEMVDTSGNVGSFTSLALDTSGRPHISYYDETNNALKYAHFDGSSWQIEMVDSGLGFAWLGSGISLVLGAANQPHIGYLDDTTDELKYAHYDGSSWTIGLIDQQGGAGTHCSLALDRQDRPHISYCRATYYSPDCIALKYALWDGLAWSFETIDTNLGDFGGYASLVLDPAGRPHVSYIDRTANQIKYAYHDGVAWQVEVVDSINGTTVTSLSLDPQGLPHIAYIDSHYPVYTLTHAYHDGQTWQIEAVDRVARYTRPSLALDAAGRPHIVYSKPSDSALTHAYHDGTAWQIEAVGAQGDEASLAIDPADHLHLAYRNGSLYYAYHDGSAWQVELVDSEGDTGYSASLFLDTAGRPHIGYMDSTNQRLRYAYLDSAGWEITTVDDSIASIYQGFASLELDTSGWPHIAYYNGSNSSDAGESWSRGGDDTWADLKYAHLCMPASDVGIVGALPLYAGETGIYSATYAPITATRPAFLWDNGTLGSSTVYSWTTPGTYTIAVTATSHCGQLSRTMAITVLLCKEVGAVQVHGPDLLQVAEVGMYMATYTPPTASLPIQFSWSGGATGSTSAYSWTVPGTYTIAVTASNACGEIVGQKGAIVQAGPYRIYLPMLKNPHL